MTSENDNEPRSAQPPFRWTGPQCDWMSTVREILMFCERGLLHRSAMLRYSGVQAYRRSVGHMRRFEHAPSFGLALYNAREASLLLNEACGQLSPSDSLYQTAYRLANMIKNHPPSKPEQTPKVPDAT